ncbi:DUF1361 domain-containing protein [Paenibacillus tuaregi]|uniref:DUF1361 domain-containing protein n=1 Tax=Paenibacillus tuaregi TaxID=1816681 RepID=UPI0008394C3D|nr:DUF1361 domain-containing protein [Paenibacillus tuaregi]
MPVKSLQEVNIRQKLIILCVLFAATVFSLLLAAYLREYTGTSMYMFLYWNLFLAWLPAGFALALDWIYIRITSHTLRWVLLGLTGITWLLFYPNSAYLITDQLHPFARFQMQGGIRFWYGTEFWYHLLLFFSVAVTGLLLGVYSLFSVHRLVRKSLGRLVGWGFAVLVLLLSSFGIYIGRFNRWNSWDAVRNPGSMISDLVSMFSDVEEMRRLVPFTGIIFMMTALSYAAIYGFSKIRH